MKKTNNSIHSFNPSTPSLRQRVIIRSPNLYKGKSEKSLTFGKVSTGGRNVQGRITVYHRGGGHKRRIRIIDFNRDCAVYSAAQVLRIEYDPNRSANIALCEGKNGRRFYIIAPQGLKENQIINGKYSELADLSIGQTKPLIEYPIGSIVHNLGAKYGRSAGTSATILKHNELKTVLRLPSKKIKEFAQQELASMGAVSNEYYFNRVLGKAGASA